MSIRELGLSSSSLTRERREKKRETGDDEVVSGEEVRLTYIGVMYNLCIQIQSHMVQVGK